MSACAGAPAQGGVPSPGPRHDFRVSYYVSCNINDDCRVNYIDEDGELRARDIVGEWEMDFGANREARLWLRVRAIGCPPRALGVEIRLGAEVVAEHRARPPSGWRCSRLYAETEFRVP